MLHWGKIGCLTNTRAALADTNIIEILYNIMCGTSSVIILYYRSLHFSFCFHSCSWRKAHDFKCKRGIVWANLQSISMKNKICCTTLLQYIALYLPHQSFCVFSCHGKRTRWTHTEAAHWSSPYCVCILVVKICKGLPKTFIFSTKLILQSILLYSQQHKTFCNMKNESIIHSNSTQRFIIAHWDRFYKKKGQN